MNTDFERLKAICEKEGFELLSESPSDNDKFYVVKKKDEWEGVEFAKRLSNGKILKITDELRLIKDVYGNYCFRDVFKPSTEQAYVEQLKQEVFERFGEIKKLDSFDLSPLNPDWPKKTAYTSFDYYYDKNEDMLLIGGLPVYRQQKWATKLAERVNIDLVKSKSYFENGFFYYNPKFKFNYYKVGKFKAFEVNKFLSSQLEKYLNREVE